MPYEVVLRNDAVSPYIEARYRGAVTADELTVSADAVMSYLGQVMPLRILADCTALAVGGHSAFDLYALADWISADPRRSTMREAVLFQPGKAVLDNIEFWEAACRNRGITVRAFDDRAAALEWLLA